MTTRDDRRESRQDCAGAAPDDTLGASRHRLPTGQCRPADRRPVAPTGEAAMSEPPQPVTRARLPVRTSVTFTRPSRVSLRIDDPTDPTELGRDTVAELFALGLETPEPDRSGWVTLGVLNIGDGITFAVGSTYLDREVALQAVGRGLERALQAGLARPHPLPPDEAPENPGTTMSEAPNQRPPTVPVRVETVTRDFDTLLDTVTVHGAHVSITRDQRPVAAILAWAPYRQAQEYLARLQVARWAAWSDAGDFDDAAYARMLTEAQFPDGFAQPSPTNPGPVGPRPARPNSEGDEGDVDDG